ncbi:MAG: 3-isopropylmalate dehydratase small subunit [Oscillospiraceae bacterium]|nr:3-isopropylmalate dehydratase small subunit [Oscillospiraceae bacterium]
MRKFETVISGAVAWLMPNVDTDAIAPMKRLILNTDELGKYSFEPYRFVNGDGDSFVLNMDFPLNDPKYSGVQILIAGENFGCGSSRETAVQAIDKCGYRVIIASSFGGIFVKNCFMQGLLPIQLEKDLVVELAKQAEAGGVFTVDLVNKEITAPDGSKIPFDIEDSRREVLLGGLDEVKRILDRSDIYDEYIRNDKKIRPWLY